MMNFKITKTQRVAVSVLMLGTLLLSPVLYSAHAQKQPETPIPVTTDKSLTRYKPTVAEVLIPPADFGDDFEVAKTAPLIDFGILPGQLQPARLWSAWGDATFFAGKFYASIGDHDAPHGKALVYEIDPALKTMEQVVDVNKAGDYTDSAKYSPGKIHSPLLNGDDGWIYFFGFRGSAAKTTSDIGYEGDPLIRFNPLTRASENLGPAIPHNSVAAAKLYPPAQMIYALGDHGRSMPEPRDQFYAYDLRSRKLVFSGGPAPLMARALIVAPSGAAYYSVAKPGTGRAPDKETRDKGEPPVGILAKYDPVAKQVSLTNIEVPGNGVLRAASRPNAAGIVYCFSSNGVLFTFDTRTEQVKEIGQPVGSGYTATCKLDSTERYLYYVPGAHGGGARHGTPVLQLDTRTGKRKVLAFLNAYIRQQRGYNLGGTYGIALSDDGSQLFICWNGRPLGGKNDDFGQCSVMILHIPESERRP